MCEGAATGLRYPAYDADTEFSYTYRHVPDYQH